MNWLRLCQGIARPDRKKDMIARSGVLFSVRGKSASAGNRIERYP